MAKDKKPVGKDKTPHDEAPDREDVSPAEGRSVEAIREEHAQAQLSLATLKAQTPRDAEAVYQQKLAVQALAEKLGQCEAAEEKT